MKKHWLIKTPDPEKVQQIQAALGVSPIVATILANRNITGIKEAALFLNPELAQLHNPFLLPDMEKAVLRLRQAIEKKEKILVYGDRDVDGVTSVAILVRSLKNLGANVVWTIPTQEGYGLHKSILEHHIKEGIQLVVTVDCGTSAVEEIAYANSLGLEVIVTDHHLPPGSLPPAYAIVNPNLGHSTYPMKDLAGCLIAFKVAYALMVSYGRNFNQEYVVLDFETTGLSALNDQIVEVSAVRIRNFVPTGMFHSLIRPPGPIPQQAVDIHGITDAMVAEAPPLETVLPRLVEFIGDSTIVAHNAKFDLAFLQQAALKFLGRQLENPSIDTLFLARETVQAPSHSLEALCQHFKIERAQAHRATEDCIATVSLFQKIEEMRDPRLQFFLEDQMDLVTLGTIADIVPLIGENRIIVKHGLSRLLKTRKLGVKKLIEGCFIKNGEIPSAKEISWTVAPLLNAAGRFSKAQLAAELLITDSEDQANALMKELLWLNQERKNLQKANIEKFSQLAQKQCNLVEDKLLFVVAEGIGHGVTGIVASQMVRQFQRPVVLLIQQDGQATGSCRSIPGFNIVAALEQCKEFLIKYGGHRAAAGLTLQPANVESVRSRLKQIAKNEIGDGALAERIEIDLELQFDHLTREILNELLTLEPYGEGNPSPVFALKGAYLLDHGLIGADKSHLRMRLTNKVKNVNAVAWGMSAMAPSLNKGETVDVVFHLETDRWNGNNIRLQLLDLDKG